jgi:hypothetical protein
MPQQLYWVREKESGQAFQMHSVDAAEGLALGDYDLINDPTHEVDPKERQAAAAAMRSTAGAPHPELQTPEQRAATRAAAKEQADIAAGTHTPPPGMPPAPPPQRQPARNVSPPPPPPGTPPKE